MSYPFRPIPTLLCAALLASTLSSAQTVPPALAAHEQEQQQRLEKIVKNQIEDLKEKTNTTPSANKDNIKGFVLSTHLRSFKDIPANINAEIEGIRTEIRALIRVVAQDIELRGNSSGALRMDERGRIHYQESPNLPKELDDRREALLRANLQNNVSVRSAQLAIRLLSDFNNTFQTQAQAAKTRQDKERIYMAQAIYVYEIADIVVNLFDTLKLEGKDEILKLHQEAQQNVATRQQNITAQTAKIKQLEQKGLMKPDQARKEEQALALMGQANQKSLEAWGDVLQKLDSMGDFLDNVQQKKELLEYKRDTAKLQIETLRDMRGVAELRDTIGAMDDLALAVADLNLLHLDDNTVRELLGYTVEK